jgi:protein-disulfide isomerase
MEKNNSFIFGLVSGIAVVSTVVLIGLVIYMLTGGRSACFASGSAANGTNTKSAKKFEECLASTKYDSKISADQNLGSQLGVNGTPATFINGYLMSGALPYEAVKQVIDALLAGKEINEKDFSFMADQETGKVVKVDMPQITDQDHVIGAKNGKITMMEFSDFECPYCGRYKGVVDQVLQNYPNDVTLIFKQFPLPASMHPNAKPAAVASECANEQGKFWEMYDKLFGLNTSGTLNADNIKKVAGEIGLK